MARTITQSVGDRIRQTRIARKLTMEELAALVSEIRGEPTHFTTIAKIERSQRTISVEWLQWISQALGVPITVLVADSPVVPVREVPVAGSIAAGNWREAILDPVDTVHVPEGAAGPNAFGLKPSGDSMDRVAPEGSIVVVDPDQLDLHDGRLYAIMNGEGETTFKRYRSDPPRLEPVSSNPFHQPMPLGREPFTVIGQAVYVVQKL